jgi:hypothetical protein
LTIPKTGDGVAIDDVRLTTRSNEIAIFPYQDAFDTTSFQKGIYPQNTGEGVTELSSSYHHSGTQSVFIGTKVNGSATASLILAIDLTNQADVFLDFWIRRTNNLTHADVAISGNGGATWTRVQELGSSSKTFSHMSINIANSANIAGIPLNSDFQLRFAFDTNYANDKTGDGIVLDDIQVNTTPISGLTTYIPLVKR